MNNFTSSELLNATEIPSSITAAPPASIIDSNRLAEMVKLKLVELSPLLLTQYQVGNLCLNESKTSSNEMLINIMRNIKKIYIESFDKNDSNYGKFNKIIEMTFNNIINNLQTLDQLNIDSNKNDVLANITGTLFRNI
jgi:hypothetical protein